MSPARRIGWQAAGHRLGEGRVDGQHAMNAGELEDAPHGAIGRDGEPQLHLARASSLMSQQEVADARGIAECRGGQVGDHLGHAGFEADDGAAIMVEWHGYGRAYPPGRRQIVGAVFRLADRDPYSRLNNVVCVCAGEVLAPGDPGQPGPDLVVDVAELVWEPIAE